MARVHFTVNGTTCSVGSEVSSEWTLLEYLRETLNLRGTKYMCREAGCGACVVTAQRDGEPPISVNTCMVSVTSCENWNITTIEEIGNRQKGYHVVQKTLAEGNGSQCGYCSPGWVMAMYSLLKKNTDMSMLEIEKSFGSNVCRCTGYRPILEAFKKFAIDSPDPIKDIEDLNICKKSGKFCKKTCDEEENDWCFIQNEEIKQLTVKRIPLEDGKIWFKVSTVEEIFQVFEKEGIDSYMLVSGNTAKGAYPIEEYPRILIDISSVVELKSCFIDQNLVLGSGTTLTETISVFDRTAVKENFEYMCKLSYHIGLVAHIPVRNIASLAGNLMIKHEYNFFQSDIFLLFETVGAQLTIQDVTRTKRVITMQQFLKTDMRGKVILNVLLPPLNATHKLITFKVMPRAQSAHAIVNSGFLYKLNDRNIVESARIVFGGISPVFNHAASTEKFLVGKPLFKNETLQGAISSLKAELLAVDNAPDPSPEYREKLALGLFYKGLLSLCPPDVLKVCYKSAIDRIRESRPTSSSKQITYTNPELWPLTQPMPKLESLLQCAGEAQYIDDLPPFPHQVFAALVLSEISKGEIVLIDPSMALACKGVISFYSAKDIPGLNTFSPKGEQLFPQDEEVFARNEVNFFNQPIGVIIAETRIIADKAAKLVNVTYKNIIKNVVLDVREAKKIPYRNKLYFSNTATNKGAEVAKVITGSSTMLGQYAFVMETVANITRPVEDELDIFTTTQWIESIQITCSRLLNIPQNKININIRRLGGSYGFKISRNIQIAQACHLAAKKLDRPVRAIQSLTTNMKASGKRYSSSSDYEVQVNSSGEIQYINLTMFEDNGHMYNEEISIYIKDLYYNVYDKTKFDFKLYDTLTDKAKNSWVRSPGTLEAITMPEIILERISYELSLDPIAVRLANLDATYRADIEEMVHEVKTRGMYTERRISVDKFNLENRWKKRGLRLSLMRWIPTGNIQLEVNLAVNHSDGTVVITHAGIEMGQGVNTKAIQLCAHFLGISIDKIRVKPNNNVVAPNTYASASSLTSQSMGIGLQRCCEQLIQRLDPIRKLLDNPTWEQLILRAFQENVDLQCHGFSSNADVVNYNIFGVCLSEVEIDVLTGELQVMRVDLLEDVGQSVSPEIDLGQVEGAFIMGLGYWTSEHLVYDTTGECLTDRTWNYYVPQARDIPLDFNVYFKNKSYSVPKILGSKCTGEPPLCLSVSVPFAIREAITSARLDSGLHYNQWYDIDGPYTAEAICLATETKTEDFKFY